MIITFCKNCLALVNQEVSAYGRGLFLASHMQREQMDVMCFSYIRISPANTQDVVAFSCESQFGTMGVFRILYVYQRRAARLDCLERYGGCECMCVFGWVYFPFSYLLNKHQ